MPVSRKAYATQTGDVAEYLSAHALAHQMIISLKHILPRITSYSAALPNNNRLVARRAWRIPYQVGGRRA